MRTVTRRGSQARRCPLSALELRLLAALLDADGRVLARDRLLDAIHGEGEGDVTRPRHRPVREAAAGEAGRRPGGSPLRRDGARRGLSGGRARRAQGGRPMRGGRDHIATRFLVATLAVAGLVLAIVALGVLRVGAQAFEALMMAAGESADHAREMFDASVTAVFVVAGLVSVAMAVVLAIYLARYLARPIERLAAGSDADRRRRPGRAGPGGRAGRAAHPRLELQPDGRTARRAGGRSPGVHRQRLARAANAADQPAGLPRGPP